MSPQLRVPRKALINALKQLKVGLGRKRGEAMLFSYRDELLVINVQGITVQIPAEGNWPGKAKTPAQPIMSIRQALPAGDPLTLSFKDGRFHIGTWSIAGDWLDISPPFIDLPLNAPLLDVLAAKNKYSQPELIASGLDEKIRGIEKDIRKRVVRASVILNPVGISQADIQRLVEEKLNCRLDWCRQA